MMAKGTLIARILRAVEMGGNRTPPSIIGLGLIEYCKLHEILPRSFSSRPYQRAFNTDRVASLQAVRELVASGDVDVLSLARPFSIAIGGTTTS